MGTKAHWLKVIAVLWWRWVVDGCQANTWKFPHLHPKLEVEKVNELSAAESGSSWLLGATGRCLLGKRMWGMRGSRNRPLQVKDSLEPLGTIEP